MNYANDHIRNVLIAGHGGAGKTSLAEALLFTAKSTDRLGRVEDGNTVCDYDPEEIRRELSVTSEDGVAVIARHMNYGLYRVEGKSDCPRDALNICRMLSLKPEIMHLIEENY